MANAPAARTMMHNNKQEKIPTEVKEQGTEKTSVYHAGKLIYDGATGESFGDGDGNGMAGPGNTLNDMLKWSIQNSNPEALKQRAAQGAAAPSRVDQEVLDHILGQPTVAKMRECLGKLEAEEMRKLQGQDNALAALEELEYYVEDMDNANDFAKIGGIQVLLQCLDQSAQTVDDDVREAVCGVFSACLQNNPKFVKSSLALNVAPSLLSLLDAAPAATPAQRKALLALSSLLRASPEDTAQARRTHSDAREAAAYAHRILGLPSMLTTLVALCGSADSKLRRRALFLFAALAKEGARLPPRWHRVVEERAARVGLRGRGTLPSEALADTALAAALLDSALSDDEDVRESSLQALTALMPSSEFKARLPSVAGQGRLRAALDAELGRVAEETNPEHASTLRKLVAEAGQMP